MFPTLNDSFLNRICCIFQERMRVGFMTYDRKINFYNIKGNLSQPQQMTVGDVGDMFVPLVDGFMCNVEESEAVIDRYFIFFREIASTST